ncbi:zf-DHHC-domain-containing protein [Xylariaceae sp. FL0804]|nr:zf-DHHC-domain-containing protein [Xylariaceae sp. FL0804]
MGVLMQVALGILAICFMIFVAFFGRLPALRHTPIAWLHRAIWVHIPNAIIALDQALSGGRLTAWTGRFGMYVMYGRHPTVLIFFFLLLAVGEYMYLPGAWPRLGGLHQVLGAAAIALPYLFLYLAAYSDPGVVTAATHARYMALYPYDFALFHPGQTCRTCRLLKPARSKHCAVCRRCVAKMDHHCVFINNCVGYGNQHWFILLLLSTAVLTAYGGALGLGLVAASARAHVPSFKLWRPRAMPWHDYFILLTLGIQDDVGVGSVTLLALMTSPLVWGLLAYHLYLIYCGTTTNESMKWEDWRLEMDDGCAFKRRLPADRPRDPRIEPGPPLSSSPLHSSSSHRVRPRRRWPVEAVQVLVRTEDGEPPDAASSIGAGPWERVWHLRDVENLYDLGFRDNLIDVFAPDGTTPLWWGPLRRRKAVVSDLERGRRAARKPKSQPGAAVVAAAT